MLGGKYGAAVAAIEQYRDQVLVPAIRNLTGNAYQTVARAIQDSTAYQTAKKGVRLFRAFGKPPAVPELKFDSPEIDFYNELDDKVGITPVLARANQLGSALNALGIELPTVGLGENLLPADLRNFDL